MARPTGPKPVEAYDMEHLTGDLVGLLDHLKIDKAIFVGHDWGGFIVWQMPLRHIDRVAGVIGVNTPHYDRLPADPIELFRKRFGDSMYIVQFQDPAREPDKIFGSRVEQTFDAFMRKPLPRKDDASAAPSVAGVGASPRLNLAFPQMIAAYDANIDPRTPILSPEEKKVFVDTFTKTGFTGGINWYRNFTRNWQRSKGSIIRARAVADDHGRERRGAAAIGRRRHGEARPRSGEVSGARQRPLDAAGKAGRGQRQADRMA
jgi:non-specific protein-tyrosine kinase